jgi:hypothetical protein
MIRLRLAGSPTRCEVGVDNRAGAEGQTPCAAPAPTRVETRSDSEVDDVHHLDGIPIAGIGADAASDAEIPADDILKVSQASHAQLRPWPIGLIVTFSPAPG